MKLSKEQHDALVLEFATKTNAVLMAFRDRALAQFHYNLETNIPKGILHPDEVVEHAIFAGFVAGAAEINGWAVEPTLLLAARILEDANCHTEAAPLFAALNKMKEQE